MGEGSRGGVVAGDLGLITDNVSDRALMIRAALIVRV